MRERLRRPKATCAEDGLVSSRCANAHERATGAWGRARGGGGVRGKEEIFGTCSGQEGRTVMSHYGKPTGWTLTFVGGCPARAYSMRLTSSPARSAAKLSSLAIRLDTLARNIPPVAVYRKCLLCKPGPGVVSLTCSARPARVSGSRQLRVAGFRTMCMQFAPHGTIASVIRCSRRFEHNSLSFLFVSATEAPACTEPSPPVLRVMNVAS